MAVDTSIIFEQRLLEKIRKLPSEKAIEVENFIDFLYQHEAESDNSLVLAATKTSENSFFKIWNNPEDAQYDTL